MDNTIFESGTTNIIIGVDEVGRGALAGPVYVCAVATTPGDFIEGVDDSKKLSEKKRTRLAVEIKNTLTFSVAQRSAKEIDETNILHATLDAMREAVHACAEKVNHEDANILVLVDGNKEIPNLKYEQRTVIKGDRLSSTISCASIVAKVERDTMMKSLCDTIYGFSGHKGYGTRKHYECLEQHGPCEIHRKTFRLSGGYINQRKRKEMCSSE